jgi:6-phosphogluconolactonase
MSMPPDSPHRLVLVGTNTRAGLSRGIYGFHFDEQSGAQVGQVELLAECGYPSFLAQHPSKPIVYAAVERAMPDGSFKGSLRAYALTQNKEKTALTLLNEVDIAAPGSPCHVIVSADACCVLTTYYNTGILSAVSVLDDGSLGKLGSVTVHQGTPGPNTKRQERPHAHSLTQSPDQRYVFACDLGLDRIFRYELDSSAARLIPNAESGAVSKPGVGPRHAKFSGDGRHFYVLNELAGSVDVFEYEAQEGLLRWQQSVSTLLPGSVENISAEIHLHGNQRFVYASNRGPDTLAVFARDLNTGLLTPVQNISCGGGHPRHFALTPDSRHLLCANRDTGNVSVFGVNADTGLLRQTFPDILVPSPTCILMVR